MISDLVTKGELPEELKNNLDAWAECISGALEKQEYLDTISNAGFRDVAIVSQRAYSEPAMHETLAGKITSISVKAYK